MSSETEIWPAVQALLKERIEREVTYNLWFSDLELQKLMDDKAYLQTPNQYKKKILESRFMDTLKQALFDVMGFAVTPYIISIETRPFDEQYYELIEKEASAQLMKINARNHAKSGSGSNEDSEGDPDGDSAGDTASGIGFDDENGDEGGDEDGGEMLPRSKRRSFRLSKQNLNFPKMYNSKDDRLEDISLLKYLEILGSKDGSLETSPSVPAYKPSYTFENFVVGDSNSLAYATCYAVAQFPAAQNNPLFLYGPPGIGKTHLLYAIAHHVEKTRPAYNIIYSTSEDFTNELLRSISHNTTEAFREKYRNADLLMIDDIQFIAGKEATQLEFFHTFNTLFEAGKQIVVASDRPPREIDVLEKRILSRFQSGAVIDIKRPDPELRAAIIRRKAIDMKIEIPAGAVTFISDNVHENIRQIEGILKNVSIHATLKNEPVTEDLVRSIVGSVVTGKTEVNPDSIIDAVSRHTGISKEKILGKSHLKSIAMARHIACYLMKEYTGMTYQQIGKVVGRHHSTVCDSVKYIEEAQKNDKSLSAQLKVLTAELGLDK